MRDLHPGDAVAIQGHIGDVFTIVGVEPWMEQAACRGLHADDWFPDDKRFRGDVRLIKAICNEICPVREQCLAYAIDRNEVWGIWGGLDAGERVDFNRAERLKERRPIDFAKCGTPSNYRQHQRRGEQPCEACRKANKRQPHGSHGRPRKDAAKAGQA
jgi:hypothetical protein